VVKPKPNLLPDYVQHSVEKPLYYRTNAIRQYWIPNIQMRMSGKEKFFFGIRISEHHTFYLALFNVSFKRPNYHLLLRQHK